MQINTSYVLQLLDIIKQQEETIVNQNKLLAELVNENLEKENMINVLGSEFRMEQG